MSDTSDTSPPDARQPPVRSRRSRLPSVRMTAALAAVTLAGGVALGAAIGPAPEASYAGGANALAQRLPLLLAAVAGHERSAATSSTATSPAPAITPQATPAPPPPAATTPASPRPASTKSAPEEPAPSAPTSASEVSRSKLPALTSVWLIELAGTSFSEALALPSAAPYITGQLLPASTLLSGWSAISASAFASEAVLGEPPAAGAAPPLLHSIVQPPCPEGPAGTACAPGAPGQLTAADEFLKATLAQILGTPIYKEHGLIVVTFTTVAIATQAGLPAGTSSATATYQPPAGAALISPFVHAGTRSAIAFNPTSPRQSLEKLLR